MVAGLLNPKDVAHATTTRPTRIVGGVNQRRWFSDALRTQADAQDFNDVIAQIRYAVDFYSITDVEGDDTLLQQAIAAAALSLTGNLASFQAVSAAADRVAYFTGGSSMSTFVATTYSRNLMANTNAAQWRDALGVSSVFSDNITAFAALTSNADLLPYFTGPGTMAMATFSAFARTLIDDADAATMRATLGFGSGVPSAFFQSIVDDADAATMRGTLGLATVAASASASDLSAGTLPSARLPASLSSIYGLTPAADRLPYYTGASTAALATFTAYGRSLVDDVDAATARTTLGLAAVAASGSASDLSAGTLPSARLPASLSIVYGLTPAADQIAYYTSGVAGALTTLSAFGRTLIDDADAATARATLSAAAATHTHAAADIVSGTLASGLFPASLSSIHGLTPAADRLPYYTSGTTAALTIFSAFARTLIDDADAATMQATLGLAAIAASASASDLTAGTLPSARLPASLSSIYGLTPAADRLPYYTGAGTAALATFTSFARTLLDDTTAAAMRTTIGAANIAGDTFTGAVTVAGGSLTVNRVGDAASALLILQADAGFSRQISAYTGASIRWNLLIGSNVAESGSNAGSNFTVSRYDDAGVFIDNPFSITRSTGIAAFTQSPTAPTPATADNSTSLSTTAYVQANLLSYALKTGAAFTGTVSATALTANAGAVMVDRTGDAAAANVIIRSDAGQIKDVNFQTGNSARFTLRTDATTEGGANAGSNFSVFAYDDAGISLGTVYTIARATRIFTFTLSPTAPTPTAGDSTGKLATTSFVATSFQPLDADLTAIAGLTSAADRLPYFTGASTAALATLTSFARTLLDDADAAAARATLALGTMATEVAANYALLAGATFTGSVTSSAFNGFVIDRAVSNRDIRYRTSGVDRWALRANSTAEGGSNAGSDFQLVAYDDAGVSLGNVFTVARSSQVLAFVNSPTAPTPIGGDSSTKLATTAFVTANFAALAGATFTGAVTATTVTATLQSGFVLDRAVLNRDIRYKTSGLDRWALRTNSVAEAGADAGSDFQLVAFDDAGVQLGSAFTIARSSQVLAFVKSPTAPTPTAGDSTTKLATTAFVAASFANLAGGTFTGAITVQGDITTNAGLLAIDRSGDAATAQLQLKSDSGQSRQILGYTGSIVRWNLALGNNVAESSGNVGSNFALSRYDDAGVAIDTPFSIVRSTGIAAFTQSPTAPTPTVGDSSLKLATTAFVAAGFQPLPYVDSKGLEYTNADNLLDNPSFELGDYGWGHNTSSSPTAGSSPYAITTGDTANAHHGGAYASLAYSGVASNRILYANRVLDAHDGEEYYAEVYVKTSADYAAVVGYRVELLCYDAAGTLLVLNNGTLVTAANSPWTRNRCALRVPSGLGAKSLFLRVASYSQTAGTVYIDTASMRRVDNILPANPYNYIDNPQFELWQAGSSFAIATTTNTFVADRWKTRRAAAGTTISKGTAFAGARQSFRVQRNSGDTTVNVVQFFTQLDPILVQNLQGKDVALSFDHIAGADYSGGGLTVIAYFGTADEVYNMATLAFATGTTNQTFPTTFSANLTAINATPSTTARRYKSDSPTTSLVVTVPSNAMSMVLRFFWTPTGTAGANDWVQITNMLLQEGMLCSDFKPLTPEAMERQCLRFYQKSFERDTTPVQNAGVGTGEELMPAPAAGAAAERLSRVRFPVPMRAVPAITLYNPAVANAQLRDETAAADCSAAATADISQKGFQATCTGNAATVVGGNIGFHWTADAQL